MNTRAVRVATGGGDAATIRRSANIKQACPELMTNEAMLAVFALCVTGEMKDDVDHSAGRNGEHV